MTLDVQYHATAKRGGASEKCGKKTEKCVFRQRVKVSLLAGSVVGRVFSRSIFFFNLRRADLSKNVDVFWKFSGLSVFGCLWESPLVKDKFATF